MEARGAADIVTEFEFQQLQCAVVAQRVDLTVTPAQHRRLGAHIRSAEAFQREFGARALSLEAVMEAT